MSKLIDLRNHNLISVDGISLPHSLSSSQPIVSAISSRDALQELTTSIWQRVSAEVNRHRAHTKKGVMVVLSKTLKNSNNNNKAR